jgi:hypothetical protein
MDTAPIEVVHRYNGTVPFHDRGCIGDVGILDHGAHKEMVFILVFEPGNSILERGAGCF